MAKVTEGYPVPLAYRERTKDILQPRYGKVRIAIDYIELGAFASH